MGKHKVDASLLGSESYSNGTSAIEDHPRTGSNYYYPSTRSRLSAWWLSWWLTEILGVVLGLAFQAATVVVLVRMQNQPLSSWNLPISLNAVIAVGTTLAKTFTLSAVASCQWEWKWLHFRRKHHKLRDMDTFDWASRGPQGSLAFMLRFPIHVASIGALVVVAALGVDAVTQQVVSFDTVNIPGRNDSVQALLGYNQHYATSNWGKFYQIQYKDRAMLGAMYQGVYQNGQDSTITCPGSCIFNETYTTLGFSSTCTNVTQATWSTKNCAKPDLNGAVTCTYTTPAGVPLWSQVIPTMEKTVVAVNASSIVNPNGPPAFYPLTHMAVLRIFGDSLDDGQNLTGQEVVECSIGLVAYQYTNLTVEGTNVTGTGTPKTLPLTLANVTANGEYPLLEFNTSDPNAHNLTIYTPDLATITGFMTSPAFYGQVGDGEAPGTDTEGVGPAFLANNNNLTIAQIVQSMTDSMTAYIRHGPGSSSAVGYVVAPVVFVRVNWVWLSLPVAAEALSVVLVLATMAWSIATTRPGLSRWQWSNVALLYHFVDETDGILRTEVTSVPDLDYLAKNTVAKLE